MLYYALMFLAGQIAWVLFLIGVVLIVVHMIGGRRALP